MSNAQIKILAKQFIDEQKRILEEHGDRVVRSKYKEAIVSAEKTFQKMSAKPASLDGQNKS
jgi:hypothetical protein